VARRGSDAQSEPVDCPRPYETKLDLVNPAIYRQGNYRILTFHYKANVLWFSISIWKLISEHYFPCFLLSFLIYIAEQAGFSALASLCMLVDCCVTNCVDLRWRSVISKLTQKWKLVFFRVLGRVWTFRRSLPNSNPVDNANSSCNRLVKFTTFRLNNNKIKPVTSWSTSLL